MKYCQNCGKKIKDSVEFCPYCGTKQSTVIEKNDLRNHLKVRKSYKGKYITCFFNIIAMIINFIIIINSTFPFLTSEHSSLYSEHSISIRRACMAFDMYANFCGLLLVIAIIFIISNTISLHNIEKTGVSKSVYTTSIIGNIIGIIPFLLGSNIMSSFFLSVFNSDQIMYWVSYLSIIAFFLLLFSVLRFFFNFEKINYK